MSELRKLAIIGRVPPPYGGVSVHLSRLLERLRRERIEYDFYDLAGKSIPELNIYPAQSRLSWLLPFLICARQKYGIIHLHTSNSNLVIASDILLAGSGVRLVYTLHGEGIYRSATQTGSRITRWLVRRALRHAAHLFPINKTVAQQLPTLGISPKHVTWMAAYLPPGSFELRSAIVPENARLFLSTHGPVIAMQGWFGASINGRDTYGLDQIPILLNGLLPLFPNLGICLVMSGSLSNTHRDSIHALRMESKMDNHWLILEDCGPAVLLYKQCDLFIRPTLSDGDSLSIRECLSMGVPVVASNAAPRPDGCVLYPVGNTNAIIDAIATRLTTSEVVIVTDDEYDHVAPLLDYYRKAWSKSS
jgi:glycosyltransferase involved in cell wall biosynthesis